MSVVPGSRGGQSPLARFVSIDEQYGSHIIQQFVGNLTRVGSVLDLGAGAGRDLRLIQSAHPDAKLFALEFFPPNIRSLQAMGATTFAVDLEREKFPFEPASLDLILANQVLEHMKEIFWIWDQVSVTLRVGGHFIVGVPNITSLHNRVLIALGFHPTQWKSYSAHVRPFSRRDTVKFCDVCFPGGYQLVGFAGAQFYPLPLGLSRAASSLWPAAAAFIFFKFRKLREYNGEFLRHPVAAALETNFFLGDPGAP